MFRVSAVPNKDQSVVKEEPSFGSNQRMTGEELKALRAALGLTQRELSSLLDLGSSTIAVWERRDQLSKGASALLREFASRTAEKQQEIHHYRSALHDQIAGLRESIDARQRQATTPVAIGEMDGRIEHILKVAVRQVIESNPPSHPNYVVDLGALHAWLKSEAKKIDWLTGVFIDGMALDELLSAHQRTHFQAMAEDMYVELLWAIRSYNLISGYNFSPDNKIRVVAFGRGGAKVLTRIATERVARVPFFYVDTDVEALLEVGFASTILLGTKGLGSDSNPDVGREAALEAKERIAEALRDAEMVCIVAGMGGGTGTGAAPVVAKIAKEMGILTVAIVTTPFLFEGSRRVQVAARGMEELSAQCDTLISIPNENLAVILGRNATLAQASRASDEVLFVALQGILRPIVHPGELAIGFAEIRSALLDMGWATIGIGRASGENRARSAANEAIRDADQRDGSSATHPSDTRQVLVNVTAGNDLSIQEFDDVREIIERRFEANRSSITLATAVDPDLGDELGITIFFSIRAKECSTGALSHGP